MKFVVACIIYLLSTLSLYAQNNGSLVLVVDTSSSISDENYYLQMESYARAMLEIPSLRNMHIEVILFASDPRRLSSGTNIMAAQAFSNTERPAMDNGSTCLENALALVDLILPTLPTPVVVDISGDGEANCFDRATIPSLLDSIAAQDARINTLLIEETMSDDPVSVERRNQTVKFYESLTRNNGFSMVVEGYYDFEFSIFEKIIMETS